MHLADLMEKSEGGQFLILSHLQQHSPSSLSEVMAETDFSKATLNKYLALINDKAKENQLALSIEREDENFRLLVGSDTKGRDIRRAFLDNAIKYQLLIYLLYHGQFQAQQLAQELLISEATLGRHISGLNFPSTMGASRVLNIKFVIFILACYERFGLVQTGNKNLPRKKDKPKLKP